MNDKVSQHLDFFNTEADNRKLAWYIAEQIMPDDIFTLRHIMSDNFKTTDNIEEKSKILNELMSSIDFDKILNPEMVQTGILRGGFSFKNSLKNYMTFYEYTQKWRSENGLSPIKIDF